MAKRKATEIRDCVQKALREGCGSKHEVKKMRHAIVLELRRIGWDWSKISDELLKWNQRNSKPFSVSEERIQLIGYVDWVKNKDCKLGCKALEDYCIGKDKCLYWGRTTKAKEQETARLGTRTSWLR